jgi:dihydrodipicolinate synthase/N-acetylneuraminate lyase
MDGAAGGIRRIADALGRPVIAYIKAEGFLTPALAAKLVADGAACAIKYAIVRPDPATDRVLEELVDKMDRSLIISGIGERPVIDHWTAFGLRAFTSGSVCVAPALSTAIKRALEAGDIARAEALRAHFLPLEDLRDHISPLRVLHEAVDQAGIAATGPMLPMLTRLGEADAGRVKSAAKALLAQDNEAPAQAAE